MRNGDRKVGKHAARVTVHYDVIERDCAQCGQPFRFVNIGLGNNRKYCSAACKQRAYRERKRRA